MHSNFPDRAARLESILHKTQRTKILPLYHETVIPEHLHYALKEHCVNYILSSLRCVSTKSYWFCRDILDQFTDDILKLPNLTPNGLLLPKKDNFLAYNQLQKTVADIFKSFNIDEHVSKVHAPINIRIINGKHSPTDDRPRASSKLHSDIWAGEFTNTLMLFLTALGDISNGIEFYEPTRRFYDEYCKPLDDYLEGAELEHTSERYWCKLKNGCAYFTDPFLLHRTIKETPRLRLSIDFRFIPHETCVTDKQIETNRHGNYIPLDDWYKIGSTNVLWTDVTVAESKAENIGPQNAYAADYTVKSIIQ